ncbi:MAG: peptidase domain-containing ABC transporter, partial [Deltaproteobacteria bacterium]|nr:peptidase domain-containing ABC transporter [Deltaproteobacteria bacterium]
MSHATTAALSRLESKLTTPRGRLALVQQMTTVECAPACLAMVLGYLGRPVSVEQLRADFGNITRGVDAAQLLRVARRHGLAGRVYRIDPDELGRLEPGAILHWGFDHYVVLRRHTARYTEILDPASGQRRVSRRELSEKLTGVALAFEADGAFRPQSNTSAWPLARYFRVLSEMRSLLVGAVAISVFSQVLGFGPPLAMALVVEDFIPRGDIRALVVMVGALGLLAVGQSVARYVRSRLLVGLTARLEARLRVSFVDHLVRLPLAFIATRSTGDLIQRINSMSALRGVLSAAAMSTVLDAAVAAIFLAALVMIDPLIALGTVGVAGLYALTVLLSAAKRRRLMTELMLAEARCQSRQVELIGGLETLKAMGREEPMAVAWAESQIDQLEAAARSNLFDAAVAAIQTLASLCVPALVIGVAGVQAAQGQLSVGTLFALAALVPGFTTPVASLLETVEQMVGAGSVAQRLNDVYDQAPEQEPGGLHHRWTVEGRVSIDGVSFAYDDGDPVLDDVSLEIEAGRSVAIVGPSGCGKSTLARCLVGLYAPTQGAIRIDGVDVEAADKVHLRRQIGFVGQDPRRVAGTVRKNITLGAPQV